MQLLIVHDDAEVGEQLAGLVANYTRHQAVLVENDHAALRWAEKHARCDLLLAQLNGPGADGLNLGGSLSEVFDGLQVLFLPDYPAAEQRLNLAKTKVFPEPIDGERLVEAIETAAAARPGPDLFQALDVLQMCCLGKRSGAVQIVQEQRSAIVYLRDGRIVHAESAVARGPEVLREIAGWNDVEFAYDPEGRAPETISLRWDEVLVPAAGDGPKEDPNLGSGSSSSRPPLPTEEAPPPKKRGFFAAFRRSR
jgi:DNA-binding NarL/FixJ family response regulator